MKSKKWHVCFSGSFWEHDLKREKVSVQMENHGETRHVRYSHGKGSATAAAKIADNERRPATFMLSNQQERLSENTGTSEKLNERISRKRWAWIAKADSV